MKILYAVLLATVAVMFTWINYSYSAPKPSFSAKLTGNQESPPVKTKAHATALFYAGEDKESLQYKILAEDLKDVTKAHLHLGPKGKNGEPVVELNTEHPKMKSGKVSGTLSEGTIKAADLQGSMAGKTIKDLEEKIKAGDVYVNVHTNQNNDGEIRGQVH